MSQEILRAIIQQENNYLTIYPPTIPAESSIYPTSFLTFISGSSNISDIAPLLEGPHIIGLVFTSPTPGNLTSSGNIAIPVTPIQNGLIILSYEPRTNKYYPTSVGGGGGNGGGPHATTHYTTGNDVVDVKLLGGYPGANTVFLRGDGTFDIGPVGPQGPAGPEGIQGIQGPQGPAGPGVAVGGAAGQVLTKIDATDYNTQWTNPAAGLTAHAETHYTSGSDAVDIKQLGGYPGNQLICLRGDGTFGSVQPAAHAFTHDNGGTDMITSLNASILTSGMLSDARLSVNVLKYTGGYPGGTTTFLRADGTFAAPTGGTGDVVGPASSVNNSVALYDGTTGKIIKDASQVTIDPANGNISNTGAIFPSGSGLKDLGAGGFQWRDLYLSNKAQVKYLFPLESTFANLPSAIQVGAIANVSNSNTSVLDAVVAGGGTKHVLVRSDGTNWRVASGPNLELNASSLTTGTIPDARLSINVLIHAGGYPGGTTTFLRADGTFALPPSGAGIDVGAANRIPYSTSATTFTGSDLLQFDGSRLLLSGAQLLIEGTVAYPYAVLRWNNLAAPANARLWQLWVDNGGSWHLQTVSDDVSVQTTVMSIGRVGTVPQGIAMDTGYILLRHATSNRIEWNPVGVAPPSFNTRSVGTKLVLYPQVNSTNVDYALGIDGGTLWFSVPANNTAQYFRWYGGTTEMMNLSAHRLTVFSAKSAVDDATLRVNSSGSQAVLDFWAAGAVRGKFRADSSGNLVMHANGSTMYFQTGAAEGTYPATLTSTAFTTARNVDIASGWNIFSNAPMYPGREDTGWTVQTSWYLCSHGAYGLKTNAGLYVGGALQVGNNIHNTAGYMYPGRSDAGGSINTSWYLASNGNYGLTTNTGLYVENHIWCNAIYARSTISVVADANALGLDIHGRASDNIGQIRFMNNSGSATHMYFQSSAGDRISFIRGSDGRPVLVIDPGFSVRPGEHNTTSSGSAQYYWTVVYSAGGVNTGSDMRLKDVKGPTRLGLDFVKKLNPVEYTWVTKKSKLRHGIIAQELKEVLDELEVEFDGLYIPDRESGQWGLNYSELIAPIIKAIQELDAKLERMYEPKAGSESA